MGTVGIRELRQDASQLVKRVEQGERIDITVAGRLTARMVAVAPKQWQAWDAVAEVFAGPDDQDWKQDVDLIDQVAVNPWDDA